MPPHSGHAASLQLRLPARFTNVGPEEGVELVAAPAPGSPEPSWCQQHDPRSSRLWSSAPPELARQRQAPASARLPREAPRAEAPMRRASLSLLRDEAPPPAAQLVHAWHALRDRCVRVV